MRMGCVGCGKKLGLGQEPLTYDDWGSTVTLAPASDVSSAAPADVPASAPSAGSQIDWGGAFEKIAAAAVDVYKAKSQADVVKAQSDVQIRLAEAKARNPWMNDPLFSSLGGGLRLPSRTGVYSQTGGFDFAPWILIAGAGVAAFLLLRR